MSKPCAQPLDETRTTSASIRSRDDDLEEIFLRFYRGEEG